MSTKTLAFFEGGQVIEMATPIFGWPKSRRRGRRSETDRCFPNGMLKPTRDELIHFILNNVLYQVDPSLGGPIFCKHIIKPNRERNRDSMYHVVLGPHPWSGVWEVVGNRRMFDIQALFLHSANTWVPQIVLSPGNYIGVDNLNGIELDPIRLRREMICREFVSAAEYDHYANPSLSVRYTAIKSAVPGIWM
ncbi:MAG: hypothetical protein C7B46_08755 [Sulfobacillus benefaciens]|uniref:Uncharacterized protein n=1 Tax=Sulfobacillus benefaciens TaxID=453960 RepID=A0A2T2XGT4_9FIRM|nr:MAG: hypothetical protein C7B46_08755 [Sulfobacillus benefaciens]